MVEHPSWKKKINPTAQTGKNNSITNFYCDPFSRFFDPFAHGDRYPAIDVSERGDVITLHAEIPGIDRDRIEVTLAKGRYITIKGDKTLERYHRDEEFYRAERSFGSFHRTIDLPAEVDESSIEATYKRGVLKIRMKKVGTAAGQIRIQRNK